MFLTRICFACCNSLMISEKLKELLFFFLGSSRPELLFYLIVFHSSKMQFECNFSTIFPHILTKAAMIYRLNYLTSKGG